MQLLNRTTLKQNGKLDFSDKQQQLKLDFTAASIDDDETLATISSFYKKTGYILDPHTAVGIAVGKIIRNPDCPLVCLATAHPAKFGEAVKKATGIDPDLPAAFIGLSSRKRKVVTIAADKEQIKNYISANSI